MKTVIFVRHAKSSWKEPDIDDHDRGLSKRGNRDAPFMAEKFAERKLKIDAIFSSTATRAYDTAKYFAKALEIKKSEIIREHDLYLADAQDLFRFIQNIDSHLDACMIFGHNPGITIAASELAGTPIENIPTTGVAAINFEIENWKQIDKNKGKLIFFEFPKMFFNDAED